VALSSTSAIRWGYSSATSGRPEQQRERHGRDLRNVGGLIEARQADRARQRDAELAPVPLPREAHLLERGASTYSTEHHAPVGRDDDPLGRDGAVTQPGLLSCSAAVADTSWRIIHAAAANSSVIDRFFAPVSRSDRRTPRTWSEMTTIVELRESRRSTARTRPKASWRKSREPGRLVAKELFEGGDAAQARC
jgi:hypothetical protein